MTRRNATLFSCVFAAFLAGLGGTSAAAPADPVTVVIGTDTTTTHHGEPAMDKRTTWSYRLTCNPTGGDLPLAADVCDVIRRYPSVMLRPPATKPSSRPSICSGTIISQSVTTVEVTTSGRTSTFTDTRGCLVMPARYAAVPIYLAAASGNRADLLRLASGLRCLEDRTFLCVSSIRQAFAQAINRAEEARILNPIRPNLPFPDEPGTESCKIRVGPAPDRYPDGKYLTGQCTTEVLGLDKITSTPTIVFRQVWPVSAHRTASHTWRIVVAGYASGARVIAATEIGAAPPQRLR